MHMSIWCTCAMRPLPYGVVWVLQTVTLSNIFSLCADSCKLALIQAVLGLVRLRTAILGLLGVLADLRLQPVDANWPQGSHGSQNGYHTKAREGSSLPPSHPGTPLSIVLLCSSITLETCLLSASSFRKTCRTKKTANDFFFPGVLQPSLLTQPDLRSLTSQADSANFVLFLQLSLKPACHKVSSTSII